MGHVDGLLLFLDLLGAVDADRDDGHHVAPPCAVFSPLRCCREATPSVPGAPSFEPRLDPVKQFHVRWGWTGASFYRLALPLRGHTHPLLTEMIHELPYVPETVERVHNSDHRPPHRPLSSGEGDRSDLNKRVISHGCLQSSFLFTARRGRRQALEGPDREVVPPASSCLTHSREGPAFFVSAHPGQAPVPTTPESLDIREHSHLGRETIRETGKPVIPYVVAPPRDR